MNDSQQISQASSLRSRSPANINLAQPATDSRGSTDKLASHMADQQSSIDNQRQYHMPLQMYQSNRVNVSLNSQSTSKPLADRSTSKSASLMHSHTNSETAQTKPTNHKNEYEKQSVAQQQAPPKAANMIPYEGGDRQQRSVSEPPQRNLGESTASYQHHNHPLSVYFKSNNQGSQSYQSQGERDRHHVSNRAEEPNDQTSLSFGRQSVNELRNYEASPGELPRQANIPPQLNRSPAQEIALNQPDPYIDGIDTGPALNRHRKSHNNYMPFQSSSLGEEGAHQSSSLGQSIPPMIHHGQQQLPIDSMQAQGWHPARQSKLSSQLERRSLLEPDHNEKYSGTNLSLFGSIQQSPNVSHRRDEKDSKQKYDEPHLLVRDHEMREDATHQSSLMNIQSSKSGQGRKNSKVHASPDVSKHSTQVIDYQHMMQSASIDDNGDKLQNSQDDQLFFKTAQPAQMSQPALASSRNDNGDYAFLTGIREVDDDLDTLKSIGGAQSNKIRNEGAYQHSQTEKRKDGYMTLGSDHLSGDQYRRRVSDVKPSSSSGHGGLSTPQVQKRGSVKQSRERLSVYDSGGRAGGANPSESYQTNPFIQNIQQQTLWSSAKSRRSENHQISFGGGPIGAMTPSIKEDQNQAQSQRRVSNPCSQDYSKMDSSEAPSRDDQVPSSYRDNIQSNYMNILNHRREPSDVTEMLSRTLYKKQLAHMGEKACMRMTLKEMLLLLDSVNDKICKQSVQQEMMLNADDPSAAEGNQVSDLGESGPQGEMNKAAKNNPESQIRFIMDMIVSGQNRGTGDPDQLNPDEERLRELKLRELKNKSNLQLMEAIRMDAKMMNLRFSDILSKENNIYLMLAKEREKNQMLQAELKKAEAMINQQPEEPKAAPPIPVTKSSLEGDLGPAQKSDSGAGKSSQLISQQLDQPAIIIDNISKNESFTQQNMSISRDFLSRLDEKDKEISALGQYVEQLKGEYSMLKVTSDASIGQLRKEMQAQQESQKQLIEQITSSQKALVTEPPVADQQAALSDTMNTNNTNNMYRRKNSLSPKRIGPQMQQLQEQNYQYLVDNQRLQDELDQAKKQAEKIMADLVKTNDINLKLNENLKALREQQQTLREQQQNKELQHAKLKVLSRDQTHQSKINSEALEKAGSVIQKLSDDLQQSLDAASKIEAENQTLRQDLHQSRQQLGHLEQQLREGEKGMQVKMTRIDEELNLQVKDLKEALRTYQEDTRGEKYKLHEQITQLQKQQKQAAEEKKQMQLGFESDIEKLEKKLKDKEMEALDSQDKQLSLKIEMTHLQQQVERDLAVKDDLYRKELEHLQRKLKYSSQNSYKTMPEETNRFYSNENNATTQRTWRPLRNKLPAENEATKRAAGGGVKGEKTLSHESMPYGSAYLSVLNDEFHRIASEIVKIREYLQGKDIDNVQSFLAKYTEDFDNFKVNVLDALINWHQKSEELSKVANKHYETMEQYKMMIIQLKQLVKEKDALIRRIHGQNKIAREKNVHQVIGMSKDLAQTNQSTLQQCRLITEQMSHRLNSKHNECIELINYQNEFREEFKRLHGDREGLAQNFHATDTELRCALQSLEELRRHTFDFKNSLKFKLDLGDDPNVLEMIPFYVEQMVSKNKELTVENKDQKEKIYELTTRCDSQKETLQRKIQDMETQVEETQRQYMRQQDEAQDAYQFKEQEFERRIEALTKELDQATQESQVRDRQIKKTEQKVEAEVKTQEELRNEIRLLAKQKQEEQQNNENLKIQYQSLEKNFKQTEERFDQKVLKVDQLEEQIVKTDQRAQRLELDLQGANEILKLRTQTLDDLNKEIINYREQKEIDKVTIEKVKDKNRQLEHSLSEVSKNEIAAKLKEKESRERRIRAEDQLRQEQEIKQQLDQEVRRYQDSLAYLSREVDEAKLNHLDLQIVQQEKERLIDTLEERDRQIQSIKQIYVDKKVSSVSVQTGESLFQEGNRLRQQIQLLEERLHISLMENKQVKDAMERQLVDMDRIIDEKRALEKELEEKGDLLSKLQRGGVDTKGNYRPIRNRSRSGSPTVTKLSHGKSVGQDYRALEQKMDMLNKVLREKESYIGKLEQELNEIRTECEKLKDKLIVYELDNMGGTSMNQNLKQSFHHYNNTNNLLTTNFNDKTMADSRIEINQNTQQIMSNHPAYHHLENSFGNGTGTGTASYNHVGQNVVTPQHQHFYTRQDSRVMSNEYSLHKFDGQHHLSMKPTAPTALHSRPEEQFFAYR